MAVLRAKAIERASKRTNAFGACSCACESACDAMRCSVRCAVGGRKWHRAHIQIVDCVSILLCIHRSFCSCARVRRIPIRLGSFALVKIKLKFECVAAAQPQPHQRPATTVNPKRRCRRFSRRARSIVCVYIEYKYTGRCAVECRDAWICTTSTAAATVLQ